MTKIEKRLLAALPIIVIIFVILLRQKINYKYEIYKQLVSTSQFDDTPIRYQLYADSLVLNFPKSAQKYSWYGEFFIWTKSPENGVHVQFPNEQEGFLGILPIKNNRLNLSGFHLSKDSLSQYTIQFVARPTLNDNYSWGIIYRPMYLYASNTMQRNQLVINKDVQDLTIYSIDLKLLNSLDEETRKFCVDSLEKQYPIYVPFE